MSRSLALRTIFGAAIAATMACATPAMALDAKQCLPMAEMNAALKAEGQRTMIIGDRIAAVGKANSAEPSRMIRRVNTITSNTDGSVGYQLEGNLPRAEASTTVCVRAKLTNVRIFRENGSDVPNAAYLGGAFNHVVDENVSSGNRPVVVADTVFGDGATLRRGLPIVMFKEAGGDVASITTLLPDGKPAMLVLMNSTEYTPAGLERANGTQLASLAYNGN